MCKCNMLSAELGFDFFDRFRFWQNYPLDQVRCWCERNTSVWPVACGLLPVPGGLYVQKKGYIFQK